MSKAPYASAAGSPKYAMVCTWPDLSQALSVVSRYTRRLGKEHWQVVRGFLDTSKEQVIYMGLIYGCESTCNLAGFSDSEFATDFDGRRSVIGYAFTIGKFLVSWKATSQPIVALSTIEAEYMALAEAAKEGIWLKGLVIDLGFPQDKAVIFCDSLSFVCLAKVRFIMYGPSI